MKTRWLLLILLFMVSLVFQPALAKKKSHGEKEDVRGIVVTSVNVAHSKIVLTIEHNQQATSYQVNLGTVLTIDGEAAKLSQIEKGMHVVTYTESDATTLSQLDVTNDKPAK